MLEQTKFPVFWPNLHIPCIFPDSYFLGSIFPVFPINQGPCHGPADPVVVIFAPPGGQRGKQ